MMDSQSPLDQETQKASDPHIYKPDEGEDDEDEIDRRIRRAGERLRRLTIVGSPEFNNDFLCEDTLTVEGGYDTGYAVNYVDCGAAAANQGTTPPPPECSCAAIITLSDVVLPCCVDDGFGNFASFTDINLNGVAIPLRNTPSAICDPGECFWENYNRGFNFVTRRRFNDSGCTSQFFTTSDAVFAEVFFTGGIYYIYVFPGIFDAVFFYAETASLASPIPNLLTSCSTAADDTHLDNAFTTCLDGGPIDFTKFAHGGTATIELTDACGACCFDDGVCTQYTEAECIQRGGIFQGVGVDCIPNPCP